MNHLQNSSKTLPFKIFLVLIILLTVLLVPVSAQEGEQTVSFRTPGIELVFQPPLRSSINSANPANIEVPRLNLMVNLFENYLQYLNHLQKIATGTSLRLLYAPEQSIENWTDDAKFIRLREIGLNTFLSQVNQFLKERSGTDANYLLESADSLFTIPDQLLRQTSKVAMRTELINHSCFQKSLEPDTDFCVIDDHQVVTARPFRRSNRLFLMTDVNDVCKADLLLKQSNVWYADLAASGDGKYIAFTDGMKPMVMAITASEGQRLFSDDNLILLSMQWAPKKPLLTGMVLNNSNQERSFFLYDAAAGSMLDLGKEKLTEISNFLNPYTCWSPDSRRVMLTSARSVHLIDLEAGKVVTNIVRVPNEIGELIWSDDSNSFALVEVIGQARQRYIFDDLDYRKSVLHRYRIRPDFSVSEDHAQRVESRNTIKLVSFWTNDRVLYLEGRLISKKLNTPFWDLSSAFKANLTAGPATAAERDSSSVISSPSTLPMQYLYVFRNLDSKLKNIYDAGFNHSNNLFTDKFENIWFIGLRRPEEVSQQSNVYNHRAAPYPFPEHNVSVLSGIPTNKMALLLKFLEEYNLRLIRFNSKTSRMFLLANFSGPLNLWSGSLRKIVDGLGNGNN
ncbi:MAG: hypothetical protein KKB51_18285 [Candidatus Riflebacteria bacterium]|nr:hypothetical protein [Candidatus Riflebacteria bacterium]